MKKTVIDWSKYTDKDGKLKPEYELNKFGFPIKVKELYDPVPKKSKVAFKRPLSAHERVMKAVKTREMILRLHSQPGDTGFDGPDYDKLTPHQLMYDEHGQEVRDPETGEQLTAGEYHVLSTEREQARKEVAALKARKEQAQLRKAALKASKAQKKASDSTLSDADTSEDAGDDNADD